MRRQRRDVVRVRVGEPDAGGRESIDPGRGAMTVSVRANGVGAKRIDSHKEYVKVRAPVDRGFGTGLPASGRQHSDAGRDGDGQCGRSRHTDDCKVEKRLTAGRR